MALVTVITASTGHRLLSKCVESIKKQTHANVQHLIFADGPERWEKVEEICGSSSSAPPGKSLDIVRLPYSIGKDRWLGHRMYAAGSYMAEGEFVMFLDDDNYLDPDHVEGCLKPLEGPNAWSYSLRKLVSPDGISLGQDDCESLGKWPSVLAPDDYFIDTNCYFLPRSVAVHVSSCWFRKFREPGQLEADRLLCRVLRQNLPNFECSYKYSVSYTVGNSPLSVQPEFFARGNAEMIRRYGGSLPWRLNPK